MTSIRFTKPWAILFALAGLFFLFSAFIDEKDELHNRVFNTSLSETRNGVVMKKVIADKITFKDGKLTSDFLKKKYGFKFIRYRINRDTSYIDHTDTEVRLLEMEATATDETNLTVSMAFSVLEWDIDGVIRITKNDRLRKYYDLSGREKGGKPKKIKKKNIIEDDDGSHHS